MAKIISLIILSLFTFNRLHATLKLDSLSIELQKTLDNKKLYLEKKELRLKELKQVLNVSSLTDEQKYDINYELSEEYKKYITDSAVYYTLKNIDLSKRLPNTKFKHMAEIQLAWLYSTQGMHLESKKILENIDVKQLPSSLFPSYYEVYMEFCSHYGQSIDNDSYYVKSELYRDSLLACLDTLSLKYKITFATKQLFIDKNESEKILFSLLEKTTHKDSERALVAYLLGLIYKKEKDSEKQKIFFTISAISDIENSIKDNASLQSLALIHYELGDIDKAYTFIQMAIDDAKFCNIRYRTIEISSFYPIINASYQEKEKKQKSELQTYLILISILSTVLIFGIIYIYKQMKRLSLIRKELYRANKKLTQLNNDLQLTNNDLHEANHIKEEYIAHFFNLCSAYINKLEDYRKLLNKKAAANKLDELFKILKSNAIIENEVEELYKNFDKIFLNLYPTFIEEFNSLLLPDERIYPKNGEYLNTELRIFALIRLGITDSVKIADFLRYSLRTVYNYRTKVRNKSAVSRDQFEDIVKKIGTVQYRNV